MADTERITAEVDRSMQADPWFSCTYALSINENAQYVLLYEAYAGTEEYQSWCCTLVSSSISAYSLFFIYNGLLLKQAPCMSQARPSVAVRG